MLLITANFHHYDGISLQGYKSLGGFQGLRKALDDGAPHTIAAIKASGLQGRGGAEYPTGRKLEQARQEPGAVKYVICNADEGEPGTFKDRELMKRDVYQMIEGILIAAFCANAAQGIVYCRVEYDWLHRHIQQGIDTLKRAGLLGENILNSGFNFDLTLFSGAGSYVCGEGFALCESLEGKSGRPRSKPPYVKQEGYKNLPTLVLNVETLSAIAAIMKFGPDEFTGHGTPACPGTKVISISGKVNSPGVYEIPFGTSLKDIIALAGGVKGGKDVGFLQLGGASGGILPASEIHTPYTYGDLTAKQASVGSGAIVVADQDDDIIDYLANVCEFFIHECCGKCVPCREGNRQLMEIMKRLKHKTATLQDLEMYTHILEVMKEASLCGSGRTEPLPFFTGRIYFETAFTRCVQNGGDVL